MTFPVSLLPPLSGNVLAPANPQGLSDDEQALIRGLADKLTLQATHMRLCNEYYEGTQRLKDLGISVPPQLNGVRTVVDWPRICVDPLVQRLRVDGFRLPGATDVDDELWGFWQANDLDAEAPLAFLDALVYGRSYMIVGAPDVPGDEPVITVESPLNLSMAWDPRTRRATAAYQAFEVEGVKRAVLYLPDVTVSMSQDQGGWVVDKRDEHRFGEVPVVRLVNRPRAADREGQSEITPAIMNTTDSACRTLLGMEIAREFYSIPHRYGLGLKETDFVNPDGTPKTALQMTMSKFIAFERDEDGNVPQVGQFQAFDPSVFTKIIDTHAQLMASYTGFPPSYFGLTSTANPASADAIRVADNGLNRRGGQLCDQFADPLERVQRLAWRFAHNGDPVPDALRRLETDWADVAAPTPLATSQAMQLQVQTGIVPPTSDVVLKELGYSAVERARLEQDRKADQAEQILAELAGSLQAKEARADLSVARDINPQAAKTLLPGAGPASQPPKP